MFAVGLFGGIGFLEVKGLGLLAGREGDVHAVATMGTGGECTALIIGGANELFTVLVLEFDGHDGLRRRV